MDWYQVLYGVTMFWLGAAYYDWKRRQRMTMKYNWKCPYCETVTTYGSNKEQILFEMVEDHLEKSHDLYTREKQDAAEVSEAFYLKKWWHVW